MKRPNDKAELAAALKQICVEQLGFDPAKITDETTFEDMGADSLDCVELVLEVEDGCDIQIPDEQTEKILSFGQAVEYIADRLSL